MLICPKCQELVMESDLKQIVYNEVDGFKEYGVDDTCPECGRYLVEARRCDACSEWWQADELEDGLCPDCRKEAGYED